jgi:uncharacterized CHY-type Zn-finger protein
MSHLIPDFVLNPVLRQARRLSRPNTSGDLDQQTNRQADFGSRDETVIDDIIEQVETLDGLGMRGGEELGTGVHLAWSPFEENEGLEEERQVHEVGRLPRLPAALRGSHMAPQQLGALGSDPQHIDVNLSDNLAFDLGDPVSGMSPAEVLSRPSAQSGQIIRHRNNSLPADDGMSALRQQILRIQALEVPAEQKARMMHRLLTRGYYQSQERFQAKSQPRTPSPESIISQERPTTPGSLSSFLWHMNGGADDPPEGQQYTFHLSLDDVKRTYAPLDPSETDEDGTTKPKEDMPVLGCQHYKRNVKLQCSTCDRWYTCRLCHDEVEDHVLIRHATKNMLCMICGCAQRAGEFCLECGERTAWYYCGVCKLWDNDPNKSIYHCNDCGICRKGRGLGKDFFHCKVGILFIVLTMLS